MKKNVIKNVRLAFFCFSILFLSSCKKNLDKAGLVEVNPDQTKNTIFPYLFNWETADFMPAPPGVNIPVPWASNTNQGFSQDIRYDYKKSDGWELVYNTFSPTQIVQPKSFVLYNKYRGLLRFYLYVDAYNAPAASDYIVHSLNLEATNGATSRHLNFAGDDLATIGTVPNKSQISAMLNYKVSSTSGWYAFEYELAYDPNISSQTYQNLNLRWTAGTVSVTQINLAGAINGSLKGTIGTPAGSPNFFVPAVKGVLSLTGLAVLNNNPTMLNTKMMTAAKEALNKGWQGVVKNVFSAIFGGNSNNVQQVSMDLNAKLTLTGTATTPAGLMDNVMVIPGISNSQSTSGFAPRYNSPLGVFTLSAKPVIKYTRRQIPSPDPQNDPRGIYYTYGLNIDPASYTIIYNPAVLASATISNVTSTIISLEPLTHYQDNGASETVGETDIRSGTNALVHRGLTLGGKFAVRIAFKVNPTNGAPSVTIIHTFPAQVVAQ